ncbi:MAG: hypothetical protein CMF22_10160 [Idiomarinaceae bacterium]|nr:hypothetical protein [Idiomarinaceae bacterium]MBG23805.1 hypothetical protein [Idiomarinaceae bacterium]|tara:strand:+ start:41007 stop:41234 length:228 start_codon:yes stop_codon:yes gene_type:complete
MEEQANQERPVKHIDVSVRVTSGEMFQFESLSVHLDDNFLSLVPNENMEEDIDVISFPVQNIVFLATHKVYEDEE